MVCRIDGGKVEFRSQNHVSWTKDLPQLASAAASLPVKQAILDGELVARSSPMERPIPSDAESFKAKRVEDLVYYVFDLLFLNEVDLRKVPLAERKDLLAKVLPPPTAKQYSLFGACCR